MSIHDADVDRVLCAICRFERIEVILDAVDALAYRCLDCETEFDETIA